MGNRQEFFVNVYENHDPAVFGTRTKADYTARLVAEWDGPTRKALIWVRYSEAGVLASVVNTSPTQESMGGANA